MGMPNMLHDTEPPAFVDHDAVIVRPVVSDTLAIVGETSAVVEVEQTSETILVAPYGSPRPPSEVGPPGPQGEQGERGPIGAAGPYSPTYEQRFASPLDTWLINHRLGQHPGVTLLDDDGSEFEADIEYPDLNNDRALGCSDDRERAASGVIRCPLRCAPLS